MALFASVVVAAAPNGAVAVGVIEFVVVALPEGMLTWAGIA